VRVLFDWGDGVHSTDFEKVWEVTVTVYVYAVVFAWWEPKVR
jgi:hypothetical protein